MPADDLSPSPSASSLSVTTPLPPWKRSFDLLSCLLVLPVLVTATALIALWIKLFSPGPVFFKQERIGYQGRRFLLFKFRTMRVDAEVASHRAHFDDLVRANRPMQKLDAARDGRLIPGGWLLRASGADELPQFINVFRSEMSLVGPRPCIPYEYVRYSAWQRLRFSSVPGLTGLWQVSGKNRTTFDEMVQLDIRYSQTRSLALDLKIALKTLPALWTQIADTRFSRRKNLPTAAFSATRAGLLPDEPANGGAPALSSQIIP
jgi:lipopolysaccharide/colanic/teichoic acid biosynthesis glycosyltransferase